MPLTKEQQALVVAYIPAAKKVAHQEWDKAKHVLDLDDLTSVAYTGLIQAAGRWDPERKSNFWAFAQPRVHGNIVDYLRKEDWATRILRGKSKILREAGQDNGASIREMSQSSGLTEKEISDTIFEMTRRPVSLEAEEVDVPVIQTIESSVLVNQLLDALVVTIARMDKMSQVVLALHYYSRKELQEISKILGVNGHRLTKLHRDAVLQIKEALEVAAKDEGMI